MINIHRMSAKVVSADDCNAAIEHIQPRKYQPAEFSAPKPMRDHIETVLYREAEQNVKVPFWKRKRLWKSMFLQEPMPDIQRLLKSTRAKNRI